MKKVKAIANEFKILTRNKYYPFKVVCKIFELDGIQAYRERYPLDVGCPDKNESYIQLTVPAPCPSTKLQKVFEKLQKVLGYIPDDPSSINSNDMTYRLAKHWGFKRLANEALEIEKKRIVEDTIKWRPIIEVKESRKKNRQRIKKKHYEKRPTLSRETFNAIKRHYLISERSGENSDQRITGLKSWYDKFRSNKAWPSYGTSSLKKIAQSRTYESAMRNLNLKPKKTAGINRSQS